MTFIQCEDAAVCACYTKGRLSNCVITQCKQNAITCEQNALIELEGSQTKVQVDVDGNYNASQLLYTCYPSSRIHLHFPLTAESIFTRTRNLNHKGENDYGGKGEIAIVDSDGNKTKIIHNIIN
jgi:hypothetical protein